MLLSSLLCETAHLKTVHFKDVEVTGVSIDSKHVLQSDLFVCFAGGEHDGHEFAGEALAAGASALVAERELPFPVPQVIVEDGRAASAAFSAAFYGHPEKRLKIIGVTGTNGKTTTAHMLASIFAAAG